MRPDALLGTDVLSAVVTRARAYLSDHSNLAFSILTRFEILRGLKARHAAAQLAALDRLCAASRVLPLIESIVVPAQQGRAGGPLGHYTSQFSTRRPGTHLSGLRCETRDCLGQRR